jgi:hypothetical protein
MGWLINETILLWLLLTTEGPNEERKEQRERNIMLLPEKHRGQIKDLWSQHEM